MVAQLATSGFVKRALETEAKPGSAIPPSGNIPGIATPAETKDSAG
jgi:hypothetical protein